MNYTTREMLEAGYRPTIAKSLLPGDILIDPEFNEVRVVKLEPHTLYYMICVDTINARHSYGKREEVWVVA